MISTIASLVTLSMMQQGVVHPEAPAANPPKIEKTVTLPVAPPKPANPVVGNDPRTGKPVAKRGLGPADYAYTMPEGVTTKEVVYYSDGVACYGKVFYPKGFDPQTAKRQRSFSARAGRARTSRSRSTRPRSPDMASSP